MIKRGVYAAGLSILRDDLTLDVDYTIAHAQKIIKNGLHGVLLNYLRVILLNLDF